MKIERVFVLFNKGRIYIKVLKLTLILASERRRSLRQSANERAMAEGRLKSDTLPTTFTINIQNAMPKNKSGGY